MITVKFLAGELNKTAKEIYQYDYGTILRVEGLNLPRTVEFDFAFHEKGGPSISRVALTENGITEIVLPDSVLENNKISIDYNIYVFIYITNESGCKTTNRITIPVKSRPAPETFLGDTQTTIGQVLEVVNKISSSKVTKPTVGKIGQVLAVKSVDSAGKPVEFEAKDIVGGTSGNITEHNSDAQAHGDIRQEVGKLKEDLTAHKQTTHFDGNYDNLTNKPTIPDISGLATKAELSNKADKSAIPTKLPNPQKLTFQGAVTAEYDGSGAVTIQIPNGSGGSADVERIEKLVTDTNVTLEPNKLYIFPEMASLTYSLKAPSKPNVANEYHFVFKSGASATQLVHAVGVNVGSFKVEPNKIYEVSIMENLLTSQSWAVV